MSRFKISLAVALIHVLSAPTVWAMMSDEPQGDDRKEALVRLMPARKETRLRDYLPEVADAEVQAILDDPRLIFTPIGRCRRPISFGMARCLAFTAQATTFRQMAVSHLAMGIGSFPGMLRLAHIGPRTFESSASCGCRRTTRASVLPVVWFQARQQGDGRAGMAGDSRSEPCWVKC